jgi:hypothetical protein
VGEKAGAFGCEDLRGCALGGEAAFVEQDY